MLVPLQGDISDKQMADLAGELLARVASAGSVDGLVIDASGVWMVDSHLCAALARLATSARFMGLPTVVCGLSADVVLTLQAMDIDLEGIATTLGLEEALSHLGVTRAKEKNDERRD
jgi:rsbT antagonist protein RsbS